MDGITAFVEERKGDKKGGGGERFEAVNHGSRKGKEEQRHCVTQLSGREVSGLQQIRRSRSCSPHGNTWSGLENENAAAAGSKQVGEKADVRCEVPNCQRESRLSEERNKLDARTAECDL